MRARAALKKTASYVVRMTAAQQKQLAVAVRAHALTKKLASLAKYPAIKGLQSIFIPFNPHKFSHVYSTIISFMYYDMVLLMIC